MNSLCDEGVFIVNGFGMETGLRLWWVAMATSSFLIDISSFIYVVCT